MSSKLSLSLITAVALAAAGHVAYAASAATTDSQIDSAEAGNPHSIDYPNRVRPTHPVSNAQINAAEQDNPQSYDYANRPPLQPDGNTNAEWQSEESENPASVDYPNRSDSVGTVNP